jgi:transcriptional regulator of arginine metabolism
VREASRRPRPVLSRVRRTAIAELVRSRRVATQAELQRLLRARGIAATQATLSRDLAQIGARRAPLPGGGTAYEVGGPPTAGDDAMAELVVGIRDAAALVVVQTAPGAAPAIAAQLDRARLPAVLGTIAGDDTIFVVPDRRTSPRRLAAQLTKRFAAAGRGTLA